MKTIYLVTYYSKHGLNVNSEAYKTKFHAKKGAVKRCKETEFEYEIRKYKVKKGSK